MSGCACPPGSPADPVDAGDFEVALADGKRKTSSSDEQWPRRLESRGHAEGPGSVFGSSEHAKPAVKDISGAEKALIRSV